MHSRDPVDHVYETYAVPSFESPWAVPVTDIFHHAVNIQADCS